MSNREEFVQGKMFIIPNHAKDVSLNLDNGYCTFINLHNDRCDEFGLSEEFKLKRGDTAIEIWMVNEDSNNWTDHGVPWNRDEVLQERGIERSGRLVTNFISHLPLRLIEHLTEGDAFELAADGIKVILTADQLNYRYRNFANHGDVRFEQVLEIITT